eukprot:SAG11_NODE_3462_length_2433_cov_1.595973_1_plen_205_part_00
MWSYVVAAIRFDSSVTCGLQVLAFSLNLGAIVALLGYVGGGAAAELLKDGGSAIEPEGAPVVMMGVGLLALLVQGLNAGLLLAAINQSPGARSVFLHSVRRGRPAAHPPPRSAPPHPDWDSHLRAKPLSVRGPKHWRIRYWIASPQSAWLWVPSSPWLAAPVPPTRSSRLPSPQLVAWPSRGYCSATCACCGLSHVHFRHSAFS